MIKGICPKCKALIAIDETDNLFKCPNCQEDILSSSAQKLYFRTVSMYKRKGDIALHASTNYQQAYDNFSLLSNIKENDLNVLCDLVISRLYCSTLKKIYIKEATDILLTKSDKIEIDSNNVLILSDHLSKFREDAKKIVDALKDKASISLFAKNNYLNSLEEYEYFLNSYKTIYQSLTTLNKYLKDSLELIDEELNNCIANKNISITVKNESNNEHDFYNDKNKIDNSIFPSQKKIYIIRMILYSLMGVGAVLSVVGLSLLNVNIHPGIKFSILGIGLAFFIGGYFTGHHLRSKQYNLKY